MPPLSTPSLGITQTRHQPRRFQGNAFQLPLSGSQARNQWLHHSLRTSHLSTPSLGITRRTSIPNRACRMAFQLPLSGSLVELQETGYVTKHYAFNSLSRDHLRRRDWGSCEKDHPFNSLSRDHRARFRDFPTLRGFLPRHPFAQMISKATIWIYRFAPL